MQCVCLIGRPNVGKSSIFNALVGKDKAIIMDEEGITRDRIYGNVSYDNHNFLLVDTGGIDTGSGDFKKEIRMQGEIAISDADVCLFVVDGRGELNESDYLIRDMLIKAKKRVIVVVNKLDNKVMENNLYNFYELGFPTVLGVSASHKKGINELLKEIVSKMPEEIEEDTSGICFSLVGRPNVGKSSLVNAILNTNRSIVSNVSGTTRDSVNTVFKYNGEKLTIIDTAGLRKKGKMYENIEKYSAIRSFKAIEESDVCCVVINAEEGIIEHDKHIVSYAIDTGKAVVLIVNKWDTIKDKDKALKIWKEKIKNEFQFIPYVDTIFVSATEKRQTSKIIPAVIDAYNAATKEIPTNVLNDCIIEANSLHEAPSYKGKRLKIYFTYQSGIKPPKITFEVNNKSLIHFSYERYLENKIRESFGFKGTPIILQFKQKGEEK